MKDDDDVYVSSLACSLTAQRKHRGSVLAATHNSYGGGFGCSTQQLGLSFYCNTLQFKLGFQYGISDLDRWLYRFDSACVCVSICLFLGLSVHVCVFVSVWAHKCLCWVWAHTCVFVCSLVHQPHCLYLRSPVYDCFCKEISFGAGVLFYNFCVKWWNASHKEPKCHDIKANIVFKFLVLFNNAKVSI